MPPLFTHKKQPQRIAVLGHGIKSNATGEEIAPLSAAPEQILDST